LAKAREPGRVIRLASHGLMNAVLLTLSLLGGVVVV